jgi:hypothetical protein
VGEIGREVWDYQKGLFGVETLLKETITGAPDGTSSCKIEHPPSTNPNLVMRIVFTILAFFFDFRYA